MTASEALSPQAATSRRREKRSGEGAAAAKVPSPPRTAPSATDSRACDASSPTGVDKVLLVDDRRDNLVALEAVLQPLGFELLKASSGTEALRILLDEDVSAVVLDVQMPGMDGFETAALLKSRAATRSIPILFLTAVGHSLEHELRGYEVGGVDYICKPFEPKVLQAKVRAIVQWSAEMRALDRSARVYEESGAALSRAQSPGGLAFVDGPGDKASPLLFAPPLGELVRSEQEGLSDSPFSCSSQPGGDGGWAQRFLNLTRLVDLELEANLEAPARARAAVRGALEHQPEELVEVLVLLVSELVTNAVLHARSAARVRIDVGTTAVRVEIQDSGSRLPSVEVPELTDESGRGLLMVQQLAARYGWTQLPSGKSVWFELDLPDELSA